MRHAAVEERLSCAAPAGSSAGHARIAEDVASHTAATGCVSRQPTGQMPMTTVRDMIAALQQHDPDAAVVVADQFSYRPASVVKIASTEYGIEPRGVAKVAIVPEQIA